MTLTTPSLNFEKISFSLFFFLMLYANLFTRMTEMDFNVLFYVFAFIVLGYSFKYVKWNYLAIIQLIVVCIFAVFALDPRYQLALNILSLKDIVLPFLCFFIGYRFRHFRISMVNLLNDFYFLFIVYGVVQQISFYSGNLDLVLPWDARYLEDELSRGPVNLYQGGLLRFWGTLNAFVEYQVLVVFIIALLWLNAKEVKRRKLLIINSILSIVFLVLSLERSPILMMIILVCVWKARAIQNNISRAILFLLFSSTCLFAFTSFATPYLESNMIVSYAFERITNVLTFNFSKDDAIRSRNEVEWRDSIDLAEKKYFGIGPGRVSPAASHGNGYLAPHNNFLLYYLGYGIIGLSLFTILLLAYFRYLFKLKNLDKRYFGFGLMLSFILMALFNLPFLGRPGILFFLIMSSLFQKKLNERTEF